MKLKAKFPLFIALTVLSACTMGPHYEPPITEVPCEWHQDLPDNFSDTPETDCISWWEKLNDPVLNDLITRASEQNLDLHIAAMRVLLARSEANGKKGDLYPHIDGSLNYGHVQYSRDALVTGLLANSLPIESKRHDRGFNFFEAGFDVEWEIDLFGYRAHEIAALKAQEQAAEDELCAVWVTLSAEIAKNYIELRGYQQRLAILEKTSTIQKQQVQLTKELHQRGMVDDLTLNKTEAEEAAVNAEAPLLRTAIARAIHRLSILLGYPPGALSECLEPAEMLPSLPLGQSIGVPSELLRRRPDVRKAERELAAATERVGSAIAALFPRFSLRGFVGDISTNAGNLFSPSSATWYAGPQLLVPIFNSKLLLQEVQYNKIVTRQALYRYQKTVLEALEEAENAICSYKMGEERQSHLEQAYAIHKRSADAADELYEKGLTDYLGVAASEKAKLNAESTRLQGQIDLLLSYISLYKALGGSWE
jgi:NodT family efflux transporter outer membrane factor (OMF) lipoprotein